MSIIGIFISLLIFLYFRLENVSRKSARRMQTPSVSEGHYRLIAEQSSELIALTDPAGSIRYASPSFWSILGYDPALVIGRLVFEQLHSDDVAEATRHFASVSSHGAGQGTYRLRHADASWRWIEARATRMTENGRSTIVIIGRDITERKRLEADLLHVQRLATIVCVVGGVFHDLNNLLMGIGGFAELALPELPLECSVRDDLEEIRMAADRAASLTNGLLAFAGKHIREAHILRLNNLISGMDTFLRRIIGADITLLTCSAPDLWSIKADPGQIEQVIVNLAVNARDAMPKGGTLTIASANLTVDDSNGHIYAGCTPGEYVVLMVSDNGIGMDGATRAHLFEPFFTTKAP